jgi:hypothetical protein
MPDYISLSGYAVLGGTVAAIEAHSVLQNQDSESTYQPNLDLDCDESDAPQTVFAQAQALRSYSKLHKGDGHGALGDWHFCSVRGAVAHLFRSAVSLKRAEYRSALVRELDRAGYVIERSEDSLRKRPRRLQIQ